MAYNAQRLVRTARIQMGSRLIGDYIYHPVGARAIVRNVTMRTMTAEQYYDELQWLYGGMGVEGAVLRGGFPRRASTPTVLPRCLSSCAAPCRMRGRPAVQRHDN